MPPSALYCPLLRARVPPDVPPVTVSRHLARVLGEAHELTILLQPLPGNLLYLLDGSTLFVRPGLPVSCAIGRLQGIPRALRCARVIELASELGGVPVDSWGEEPPNCERISGVFRKVG